MDVEALRTFLSIHRQGGFSQAGDAMGRSQPAISRRIALLEAELGAPLFERLPGGVALSLAGQALLPHAERITAAFEECRAAMAAHSGGAAGPVSLAMVGTLAGAEFAQVLRSFCADCPDVELSIRTATSADVSALVRRGEATLGVRYYPDPAEDLVSEWLFDEPRRIVCAPDHPLAGRCVDSLAALESETWLAFPTAAPPRAREPDAIFAQLMLAGVTSPAVMPVDSLTAQKRLVEAGYGVAVLPESAIVEEVASNTLATIEARDISLFGPVCLVTRRGGYLSPAAERLAGLLRGTGRA